MRLTKSACETRCRYSRCWHHGSLPAILECKSGVHSLFKSHELRYVEFVRNASSGESEPLLTIFFACRRNPLTRLPRMLGSNSTVPRSTDRMPAGNLR